MASDLDGLVSHRHVVVGGLRLHVSEAGDGPLVVLLHGFPDYWCSYRRQIPALAGAGSRVLAPDLRGARVVRFPDASHWVHLDQAEAENREILGFLAT